MFLSTIRRYIGKLSQVTYYIIGTWLCLASCAGLSDPRPMVYKDIPDYEGGTQRVLTVVNDPRPVEQIIKDAEELVMLKAYADAADEYAYVVYKDPSVGRYYLRYAELLERIDKDNAARKVYSQALENVPEDDPARVEIIHRMALIDANHLFKVEEAEELLHLLPSGSIERYDLAAFLYYQAHQYDSALELLNNALERVRDADQKALLMFHASLIYHELGDVKNTFGSLYHAINLSEHLGLIRDIENFWELINQDQPLGTGYPE
ncbi:MAG: hypothetical protein JRE16_10145 [Deltaproteobacteria bacterium]|nr:hypothetical protein [Deltaproteobacteria bacterium]MBW2504913.1 hypothetical protein [Deltaproteobacteria bacterium]MBW2520857.1 hypothetical protein [Deltaproteobacteria bacterium]